MPNGGVPMHMALYPKDGTPYVIYCDGGSLSLYGAVEWEKAKSQAKPILTLTDDEGAAVAWFLKYWLGEHTLQPGYNMRDRVKSEYDF